jgi:ATP-binding cassette subfamily B protein
MFGPDGGRRLYDRRPASRFASASRCGGSSAISALLAGIAHILGLIIGNTWTQVITPRLTGQAVDCYLTPGALRGLSPNTPAGGQVAFGGAARTNCQLNVPALGLTPLPATSSTADYIAALGRLVLVLLGIYAVGAFMGGLQFYLMSWAGQRVVKTIRRILSHIRASATTPNMKPDRS